MQQLGAVLRKMAVHHRSQDLGAAQPAAQTNELGKLLVVHFVHRLLHAVLSAIEFPTPMPLAKLTTRCPISFTLGASSACTAMKPSAMTVPRNRAMRGRSVKFVRLFVRRTAFQLKLTIF